MGFSDNSELVKKMLEEATVSGVLEAAGEVQAQVIRNTRVDSGITKQSWQTKVENNGHTAIVGNTLQNAIWEEFGTGQYALHGDGRKTPWSYQDRNGKWHTTKGKKPSRAFQHAFTEKKNDMIKCIARAIENKFK